MAFNLSDGWNNFWNGILGNWHSPYYVPTDPNSFTPVVDSKNAQELQAAQAAYDSEVESRKQQIAIESPSTSSDVLNQDLVGVSDFGYSNENNAQYQDYNYYDDYLNMLKKGSDIGLFATAQNVVDEAQKDRAFQALEAEKNRAWYENMSDTSYQRQIKDLEAAGLNPILGWAHSGVGSPTAMAPTATGRSTNLQAQAPSLSDYINAGSNLVNSASKLISSVVKLL